MMDGYLNEDWKQLQRDMKAAFRQHDAHEFTLDALSRLVRAAPNMHLDIFVLKYTAISAVLVTGTSI